MKSSCVIFSLIAMCSWSVMQAQQPIGTTSWLLIDDTQGGREIECDVRYPGVSDTAEAAPDNGPFPLVATEQTFAPSHQNFGLDLAFVANEMVQNGATGILDGWLQPHAAIAGHSMGGGATWLAASTNPLTTQLLPLRRTKPTHPQSLQSFVLNTQIYSLNNHTKWKTYQS